MKPRNVVFRPLLIEPEKAASISAPPPITNQVETSWLLTTSPRSSASSRRFWVGSSVRSASCWSFSAMRRICARRQEAQHAFGVIEEGHHHGAKHQHQNEEADQDRQ